MEINIKGNPVEVKEMLDELTMLEAEKEPESLQHITRADAVDIIHELAEKCREVRQLEADKEAMKAEIAHLNQLLKDQDEKAAQVHDAYEKAIQDIREHEKGLTVKNIAEAYKSGLIWFCTRREGKRVYQTKRADGRLCDDMEKFLYHNADRKVKAIEVQTGENNYFPVLVVEIE